VKTAISALSILLLLMAGCANPRFSPAREIRGRELIRVLNVEHNYDKAVSDSRGEMVYALLRSAQEIHIYQGARRVNSIGGLGFERTNFQRLADIGVDTDGGLLALDTAQKLLRKFSPEGRLMAELQLKGLQQPELFCVGSDGTLFVHDSASSEIVSFSRLDASELYRFGRFELELPSWLACSRNYVYAYSRERDRTYVFYQLGQHKWTWEGLWAFDDFDNPIQSQPETYESRSFRQPRAISVNGAVQTETRDFEIKMTRLIYGGSNDAAQ